MFKNKLILGILILAAIIVIAFLVVVFNTETSIVGAQNPSGNNGTIEQTVITLDAKRWEYSMPEIRVKQGDHVKIMIINEDTTHGIAIPDFGVSGVESVEFVADKTGSFEFKCPTMCGQGHRNMTGTLIVE